LDYLEKVPVMNSPDEKPQPAHGTEALEDGWVINPKVVRKAPREGTMTSISVKEAADPVNRLNDGWDKRK
jgi:hypothetical protein